MRFADGRQEQFGQFARVRFRWIVLGPKTAQGFTHHLTGVSVSTGLEFLGDEVFEIFCQRDLHGRNFLPGRTHVNQSATLKEPNPKPQKYEDVVKSAEQAAVLGLVY